MSLTIAFCTADFAVMSGDYRRTNKYDESDYYDDTPKAFHLSDNVVGAITGDLQVMQELRSSLRINKNAKFPAVLKAVEKALATYKGTDAQCTFIIAGKDSKGRMKLAEISHHADYRTQVQTIKPGEIKWRYAYSTIDPADAIEKYYEQLDVADAQGIQQLARLVNAEVAGSDGCVSEKCCLVKI